MAMQNGMLFLHAEQTSSVSAKITSQYGHGDVGSSSSDLSGFLYTTTTTITTTTVVVVVVVVVAVLFCSDIFIHKSYVLYCVLCFTVALRQPLNKLIVMMMMMMLLLLLLVLLPQHVEH